jgi:hypothetical protein
MSRHSLRKTFADRENRSLVHGVKYAFPTKRGEVTRGLPTSYAAPPLNKHMEPGSELPPVWPFPEGQHRGVSLEPLYKTAPVAAVRDRVLYELLPNTASQGRQPLLLGRLRTLAGSNG